MSKRNGRPIASPETEIRNCATEGLRRMHETPVVRNNSINTVTVTLTSSWGEIVIELFAQSPYQNSNYRVTHPHFGRWIGYLNGSGTRNNEFGCRVGKPTPF